MDLQNNTGPGNDVLLAKAMMGDRAGVLAMLRAAKNRDSTGGVPMGPARNLIAWALAANIANVHEEDAWFRSARDRQYTDFGKLEYPDLAGRSNNHSQAASTALVMIDLHLRDFAHLEQKVLPPLKAQITGDQSFRFRFGDLGYQADPSKPVVIGLKGSSKSGVNLDGSLPEELRRHGSFPAMVCGDYVQATSGYFLLMGQALHVAGYPAFGWGDAAIQRVFEFMRRIGCDPNGDDQWLGHAAQGILGQPYLPLGVGDGKYMCCTDWLYGN